MSRKRTGEVEDRLIIRQVETFLERADEYSAGKINK
jgi:hypothetical protein